eukprot:scaffold13167_cov123-Isochrysis_galbana.AAC.2
MKTNLYLRSAFVSAAAAMQRARGVRRCGSGCWRHSRGCPPRPPPLPLPPPTVSSARLFSDSEPASVSAVRH